mgnify:CR=1 FL=1
MTSTRSDLSRRSPERLRLGTKTDVSRRPWTKAQIRQARHTPLVPILEALGYQLQPLKNGNYRLCRLATEIVVKDHYWVCKDHDTAADARKSSGNAIDFLVEVEGMTFSQAMDQLRSHHEHTRST